MPQNDSRRHCSVVSIKYNPWDIIFSKFSPKNPQKKGTDLYKSVKVKAKAEVKVVWHI